MTEASMPTIGAQPSRAASGRVARGWAALVDRNDNRASPIVVQHGSGLGVKDIHPPRDRFGGVVHPLLDLAAILHAPLQLGDLHLQVNHDVDFRATLLEFRAQQWRLRDGTRESIEQATGAAIGLPQTFADDTDHQLVGDQAALVHVLGRDPAQFGAVLLGLTSSISPVERWGITELPH